MIETQFQKIMEVAGIVEAPAVIRFYRDGDSSQPSIIVQRDVQGCRVMQRAGTDPETWSCAWFDDAGSLIVAERFCCGRQELDSRQADRFLNRLLSEPFKDMTRELIPLALH